jgi:hypothetical protein
MNYRAILCGALTVAATSLTAVPSSAMPISPASILTAAEDSDLIVQVRGPEKKGGKTASRSAGASRSASSNAKGNRNAKVDANDKVNRNANANGNANVNRNANANGNANVNRNANVNGNANVNRNTNVNANRNANVNAVAVVRPWTPRPYYGTVVAGVTLGTVIYTTTVPAAPSPEVCWVWSNSAHTQGYWDYCVSL